MDVFISLFYIFSFEYLEGSVVVIELVFRLYFRIIYYSIFIAKQQKHTVKLVFQS